MQLSLCLITCTWFWLAHKRFWFARVLFFVCVLLVAVTMIAASFPADVHTPAGRQFVLPTTIVCAVCATCAGWQSYFHDGVEAHINSECRRIHAVICLAQAILWTSSALSCAAGRCTWGVIRVVFAFDGLIFLLSNLLLFYFGPPPFYQPRNVSLHAAIVRATTTPLLGLLLTPANRQRIAAFANHAGWNHVTLTLDLVGRGTDVRKSKQIESDRSSSSNPEGGGQDEHRNANHHTAVARHARPHKSPARRQ